MTTPDSYQFRDRGPTQDHGPLAHPSRLTPGAYIRALADRELPDARPESAPGGLPSDLDARVTFERTLRDMVARSMQAQQTPAPADLRAAVQRLMVETPDRAPASYKLHRFTRFAAVAAVLGLAATLIYVAGNRSFLTPGGGGQTAGLSVSTISSFVGKEHERVADFGQSYEKKFRARSVEEAADLALDLFGFAPCSFLKRIEALDNAGYHLAGFSNCSVPGKGKSGHFIFKTSDTNHAPISLFVQLDTGCLKIDGSCCHRCETVGDIKGTMVAWKDDRFDYYLYTCDPKAVEAARMALNAPQHVADVR